MTSTRRVKLHKNIQVDNPWNSKFYTALDGIINRAVEENEFRSINEGSGYRKIKSDKGTYNITAAPYEGFFSSRRGIVISVKYHGKGDDEVVRRESEVAQQIYDEIIRVAKVPRDPTPAAPPKSWPPHYM